MGTPQNWLKIIKNRSAPARRDNLIHNSMVKTYRYRINRGEEVVTFDLTFKRFDLVLDFRGFNYYKVKLIAIDEICYREMVRFQISSPLYCIS